AFGLACLALVVLLWRPRWPRSRAEFGHLVVAGLLMHAVQLGGSHYAQYLGMSAGVAALVISCQPLLSAVVASRFLNERLAPGQWAGVFVGLAGVALVVWHKIDIREVTPGSLLGTLIALGGVTSATLYQRVFCPKSDLKAAALAQFGVAPGWLTVLGMAVACGGVAMTVWNPRWRSSTS